MSPAIPPDGYIMGDKAMREAMAASLGADVAAIGHYVIVVQSSLPCEGWDVLTCCPVTLEHNAALLRAMAAQTDERSRRLSS